jgi:hypothetical protein
MNIVEGGSLSGYASFGRLASKKTIDYIKDRRDSFKSRITSDRIANLVFNFETSARRLDIGELKDEIRIAKRRERNLFDDGHIRYIHEPGDIQHSNFTMRRLIMADVEIQSKARSNLIDGWVNLYVDPDEGKSEWRHRDYRRLNKGLYKKTEEGVTRSSYYYEDQGADELTLTEKLDALRTIDRIKNLIRLGGEDPTSLNGGQL